MKTTPSGDDAERKRVQDDITNYGCHIIMINDDGYLPGFVYTIGLFERFQQPEIICFGLKTEVQAALLNHACDLMKQGEQIVSGKLYTGFLEGYTIQFVEVAKDYYQYYVGYGGWYYGMTWDFPVLQLVWPDKQSLFTWEAGFNPNWKFKQPLLDRNTDCMFYEPLDLAVLTTRQAFEGEPILYVYHDEDGAWQFLTRLEPDNADIKLVALSEITRLDLAINQIHQLSYGWRAWRVDRHSEWVMEEVDPKAQEE